MRQSSWMWSIATLALSSTVSEIHVTCTATKGRKSPIRSYTQSHLTLSLGMTPFEFWDESDMCRNYGRVLELSVVRFDKMQSVTDGQTNRRTDRQTDISTMAISALVKTEQRQALGSRCSRLHYPLFYSLSLSIYQLDYFVTSLLSFGQEPRTHPTTNFWIS